MVETSRDLEALPRAVTVFKGATINIYAHYGTLDCSLRQRPLPCLADFLGLDTEFFFSPL